jgi:hypothetical protein
MPLPVTGKMGTVIGNFTAITYFKGLPKKQEGK